jgi:hypothetical protein
MNLFDWAFKHIINPSPYNFASFGFECARSVFLSVLPLTLIHTTIWINSFAVSMWFIIKAVAGINTAISKSNLTQLTLVHIIINSI